jgi:hypothetical protein
VKEEEVACSYIGSAESELQRISGITKQTLRWSKESIQKAEYCTAEVLFEDLSPLFAGKIKIDKSKSRSQGEKMFAFTG